MSQKTGLIIYVSLPLLTPKILSLPFDPQDNAFLSWAHSYAAFHNQSNFRVCGAPPSPSVEGFLWWTSPRQGKDFLQVCEYLPQQSYVMPLLNLMVSNNPKGRTRLSNVGFPGSSAGTKSTCSAGDSGLIPGCGRSAGEGIGYPL